MAMVWTAWNNGKHHSSGAGYGIKVPIADRNTHFKRDWSTVTLELPDDASRMIEINVSKSSFWSDTCHELISQEIGRWLLEKRIAPWPPGQPPKLRIESLADRRFRVVGVAT
jgi:hypothetical protein